MIQVVKDGRMDKEAYRLKHLELLEAILAELKRLI